MINSKFIIGSAQFGMDYGITNHTGKVQEGELVKILQHAKQNNIHLIDTAAAYGNSEEVLGQLADTSFNFITKLPRLNDTKNIDQQLQASYEQSLRRLNRTTCYGLLVHDCDSLSTPYGNEIYKAFANLKQAGMVEKIGVSVYSPAQAKSILTKFDFDILQFPLNLLDQRFLDKALLLDLKNKGLELHARSIFLQGLLLSPYEEVPGYFDKIKPILMQLHHQSKSTGKSIKQFIIDFISSIDQLDNYIFGVANYTQFAEVIDLLSQSTSHEHDYHVFACHDLTIIDARQWRLG